MKNRLVFAFALASLIAVAGQLSPVVSWDSGSAAVLAACAAVGYPSTPVATNISRHFSADCITFSGSCSTPADGTSVTTWADSSGNAADATKQTGTATFHTNQLNGKPTVTLSSAGFTFTHVVSPATFSSFEVWIGTGMTGGNASQIIGGAHANLVRGVRNLKQMVESVGDCNSTGTSTLTNSTWFLTAATADVGVTNAIVFRKNIASDGTGGVCENQVGTGNFGAIGYQTQSNGDFLNGQIAELITYTDVKNATDVLKNECYLYGKWKPF